MTIESWRSRPVFISSTFRDMQAERDHLRNHVFARLEEKLWENRHHLEPIDLRQGVETAEAATEAARELLVLKVCLDEIKRSRPYPIVLLGDRYGWVPPDDRMAVAAQEAGFQTDLTGKSVTALEIEFGILKEDPDQRRRSFFFFREPLPCDDPDYNDACSPDPQVRARHDKLEAMKRRLAEDPELGPRVHTYRTGWDAQNKRVIGLEDWGNQVFELLWKDLEEETRAFAAQPPPTWEEAERQALAEFVEHRTRGFVGREDLTRQLLALARSPVAQASSPASSGGISPTGTDALHWAACLTGPPGSGKSALFAHIHRTLSDAPRSDLFLLSNAAGISTRSASVDAMLRRWIQEMADFLRIANPLPEKASAEDVENTFAALLGRAAQQRRVVVLIDALNQFEPTVRARHITWLKPQSWPSNARLIATALPGPQAEALLAKDTFGVPASAGPGFGVPPSGGPSAGSHPQDRPKAELQTSAPHRVVVELALPPLTEADAEQIAKKVWKRYHRQFNRDVFRGLAGKRLPDATPSAGNPLWLNLALEQLNLLDADDFARAEREFTGGPADRLRALMSDVAQRLPAGVEGLFDWMLERTEKVHGAGWTRALATAIALSRSGWRESDLLALVPRLAELLFPSTTNREVGRVTPCAPFGPSEGNDGAHGVTRPTTVAVFDSLRLAALRRAFRGQAVKRGALEQLDFFHAQMRAAVLRRCVTGEELRRKLHSALADHLLGLPETDAGRANETMHHLIEADDRPRAARYYASRQHRVCVAFGQADDRPRAARYYASFRNPSPALAAATQTLANRILAATDAEANAAVDWTSSLLLEPELELLQIAALANRFQIDLNDALKNEGRLGPRRRLLEATREAGERLAAADPSNAEWQGDLCVSQEMLGDVLSAQGDSAGAFQAYRESLAVRQRLAAADPSNAVWQGDLCVSQEMLGDVLSVQGDSAGALQAYRESLAVRQRLAAADPSNVRWQRDLSVSHGRLGGVLSAQGDLAGALQAYRDSLAVRQRLAAADPSNAGWQRDLSVGHLKLGAALSVQGDLAGALQAYRESLAVSQRLAAADPSNAGWQRDLASEFLISRGGA